MAKISECKLNDELLVEVTDDYVVFGHSCEQCYPGYMDSREELDILIKYLQSVKLYWKK